MAKKLYLRQHCSTCIHFQDEDENGAGHCTIYDNVQYAEDRACENYDG